MGDRDNEEEGVGEANIPLLMDQHEGEEDGDIMVETKKLWRIVGPSIFTRITTYLILVITQAFAGHLGELELAAISLSSTMSSSASTSGVYLQRSWIILFLCSILLLPMHFFATPILKYFGQPDDIAELSGTIAVWVVPINFAFVFFFPLNRFLQCQLKNMGPWLLLTCLGVSTPSSYLLTPLAEVVRSLIGSVSPSKLSPDFGNLLSSLLPRELCFGTLR
ncbi:hypothetical protein F2Q69_00000411 [Brassica cretica]|uniref:Uncharacterized protein n=1 Tax=Brassica cretica TaxID=69181 RepID=A0A8S9PIH5_BRACR|nr:hypothetical protein F2Q69_00000411 [Brassica cretica]